MNEFPRKRNSSCFAKLKFWEISGWVFQDSPIRVKLKIANLIPGWIFKRVWICVWQYFNSCTCKGHRCHCSYTGSFGKLLMVLNFKIFVVISSSTGSVKIWNRKSKSIFKKFFVKSCLDSFKLSEYDSHVLIRYGVRGYWIFISRDANTGSGPNQ